MTPSFTSNDPAGDCCQPVRVLPSKIDLQRGQPGNAPGAVGSGVLLVSPGALASLEPPPLPPVA